MKRVFIIMMTILVVVLLSSCSGKNSDSSMTSGEISTAASEPVCTAAPAAFRNSGIFVSEEAKSSNGGTHPCVKFGDDMSWAMGSGVEVLYQTNGKDFLYRLKGEYTQNADRIKAMLIPNGSSQPVEYMFVEFQILSETKLQVTAVSKGFFPQWDWLEEGDILIFDEKASDKETEEESSGESSSETDSSGSTAAPVPFKMDVLYVTKESKGTMPNGYELHPYINFELVNGWHMGQDPMTSYGLHGKFVQDGDRIIAMRKDGDNLPLQEALFIELKILSETELIVVKVADDFYTSSGISWQWLAEGDVLEVKQD